MTVAEWRKKHRRCEFCKHLRILYAPPLCEGDIFECKAKAKMVFATLPRPFCRVFQLKENDNA
jgi:hypothetical protein